MWWCLLLLVAVASESLHGHAFMAQRRGARHNSLSPAGKALDGLLRLWKTTADADRGTALRRRVMTEATESLGGRMNGIKQGRLRRSTARRYRRLLEELWRGFVRERGRKQAVRLLHFSKAGGTSICTLVRQCTAAPRANAIHKNPMLHTCARARAGQHSSPHMLCSCALFGPKGQNERVPDSRHGVQGLA